MDYLKKGITSEENFLKISSCSQIPIEVRRKKRLLALNVIVLMVRIDFHPSTGENEERVSGEAGCRRCGYRVYDAEKLMAAGRVSRVAVER